MRYMERKTIQGLSAAILTGGLIIGAKVAEARANEDVNKGLDNRPRAKEVFDDNSAMTFGEVWRKHLDVQPLQDLVVGKVVDFDQYCTPYEKGCGFDETDPEFDSKFHGHVHGYKVEFVNGRWEYRLEK